MRGSPKSQARRRQHLGPTLALAWTVIASHGFAAPVTPASYEPAALRAWLGQATDLRPEDVVAVSRSSLSAIARRRSDVSGSVFALVRSEALDPALPALEGAASWAVEVEVACGAREIRAGETRGYPLHNLKGAATVLRAADTEWRRPKAGTQLDSVVRAVCEPAFKGPLTVAVARGERRPAAAPSARPARPLARSNARAQLLAASAPEAAERARLELAKDYPDRELRVERAAANGRTVFRVLAQGFADDREAAAFCRTARAKGRACFVRGGAPP